MINITAPSVRSILACCVGIILSASLCLAKAEASPAYKKKTVIDFDGATIEGKSRKPYSAYLSKQRDPAMDDLVKWKFNWQRNLEHSRESLENNL